MTLSHPSRRLRPQKAPMQLNLNLLSAPIVTPTTSSKHWIGKVFNLCSRVHSEAGNIRYEMFTDQRFVFIDVRGAQDTSDSQGGVSMNDQEDLSDQSEGESYSYSAPSGEPLSRDPSEPLFDADFQVRRCRKAHRIILCRRSSMSMMITWLRCFFFLSHHPVFFLGSSPPRAPLLQPRILLLVTQLISWA